MNFILELLSLPSRLLNILTGGGADLTFSARTYRDGLWIEPVINLLFRPFGTREHCRWAWDRELERSRANVAFAEGREK